METTSKYQELKEIYNHVQQYRHEFLYWAIPKGWMKETSAEDYHEMIRKFAVELNTPFEQLIDPETQNYFTIQDGEDNRIFIYHPGTSLEDATHSDPNDPYWSLGRREIAGTRIYFSVY